MDQILVHAMAGSFPNISWAILDERSWTTGTSLPCSMYLRSWTTGTSLSSSMYLRLLMEKFLKLATLWLLIHVINSLVTRDVISLKQIRPCLV
ncbi:uncharacterized protein [Arachis hypogaea]|uniref:uncharacterized protein isoform X2 n=1 Tax=Arachis hypogaea TaxID=3818 RepID=UPI003B21F4B3